MQTLLFLISENQATNISKKLSKSIKIISIEAGIR